MAKITAAARSNNLFYSYDILLLCNLMQLKPQPGRESNNRIVAQTVSASVDTCHTLCLSIFKMCDTKLKI